MTGEFKLLYQQLREARAEAKAKRQALRGRPDYLQIKQREKDIQALKQKLEDKLDSFEDEILGRYLTSTGSSRVYYQRSDQWGSAVQTNINSRVLDAMKETMPISYLTGTQIEELVNTMIEQDKNVEYPNFRALNAQVEMLDGEEYELYERASAMESEADDADTKVNKLGTRIRNMKREREEAGKDREHPERLKRLKARDRVRAHYLEKIPQIRQAMTRHAGQKPQREGV